MGIASEIVPQWDGRIFFVFFVALSSLECLYYILWLNITGPGIFCKSVFLRIDQGIAACFDSCRNLKRGTGVEVLTLYPVFHFGKASVGSINRKVKWMKGERKC